jgi:hypothetical protein
MWSGKSLLAMIQKFWAIVQHAIDPKSTSGGLCGAVAAVFPDRTAGSGRRPGTGRSTSKGCSFNFLPVL